MSTRYTCLVTCLLVSPVVVGLARGQSVKINFQTPAAPVPQGYLPDFGEVYGDRGNGWTYGWSLDVTAHTRYRNSTNAPDVRWDTLAHLQKGGQEAYWEIALGSGLYSIYIVAGDPSYEDHTNVFEVEGTVVQDLETPSDNFDQFLLMVWVTDGNLTIRPAQGAVNSRICFVDITLSRYLGLAWGPSPADRAEDVGRDLLMSWTAGDYAASHDVYLGRVRQDVANATRDDPLGVLVSKGQAGTTFDAAGLLEYAVTYYWRVDEVNAPPDNAIYKGRVWSFTVEPYSYPVQVAGATASSSVSADCGPGKTTDGSGLTGLEHDTAINHTWLSASTPAWIQYDLGDLYQLDRMLVWNSNSSMEGLMGFGARDVAIEVSNDGQNWTQFGPVQEFARAPGAAGYMPNTEVDLTGVVARYVRLTIQTNWAGSAGNCGLSEVRFLYIPLAAYGPYPGPGAADVPPDTVLGWRAGRYASSHKVYIGTDPDAVRDRTIQAIVTQRPYLDLGSGGLEYSTTYYWRVDEVNGAQAWSGQLWNFRTSEYALVDDFEAYDDGCNRIFYAWIDGLGHSGFPECGVAPANGNGSGSTVGNQDPPFAETEIVHGGDQSMPLAYSGPSETTRQFSPAQDWTAGGARYLVLYFKGQPANQPGQLYVKINGTRINYAGNPDAVRTVVWKQWNIDLSGIGQAKSVGSLTIGIDSGGSGRLYIDDIRLYGQAPPILVPKDPASDGLSAAYSLDGNCQDGSGNGLHGTAKNGPNYVEGILGQCVSLDGLNDYVELPLGQLISSCTSMTISLWVNWAGQVGNWQRVFDFGTSINNSMYLTPTAPEGLKSVLRFAITNSGPNGESQLSAPRILPAGWHHIAVVIDGESYAMDLYLDGQAIASSATSILPKDLGVTDKNRLGRSQSSAHRYFKGLIDELRIYSRPLSAEEVAYLAGDRP